MNEYDAEISRLIRQHGKAAVDGWLAEAEAEQRAEDERDAALPEHVNTITRLAACLGVSRSKLSELINTDARFPQRTADGWPLHLCGAFLKLKEHLRNEPDSILAPAFRERFPIRTASTE